MDKYIDFIFVVIIFLLNLANLKQIIASPQFKESGLLQARFHSVSCGLVFYKKESGMETKICIDCKQKKLVNEFHWRKDQNRYRAECKICYRVRFRKRYNSPRFQKYIVSKECKERLTRNYKNSKKYYSDIKDKARYISKSAYKKGEIQKENCVLCDNNKSVQHHINYNRPFDIVWLCRTCHGYIHRLLRVIKSTSPKGA